MLRLKIIFFEARREASRLPGGGGLSRVVWRWVEKRFAMAVGDGSLSGRWQMLRPVLVILSAM